MKKLMFMLSILFMAGAINANGAESTAEGDRPICDDSKQDDYTDMDQIVADSMYINSHSHKERATAQFTFIKDQCKPNGFKLSWMKGGEVLMASCTTSSNGHASFTTYVVSFRNVRTQVGGVRMGALVWRGGMDQCVRLVPLNDETQVLHSVTGK